MDIFSYVVKHDYGFAPNPFGGFLTLATCKPQIRQHAAIGDFLVGTGSAATVGNRKLVYAAQISKVISIEEYGTSRKYRIKQPSDDGEPWKSHGDNIYFKVGGGWRQRANRPAVLSVVPIRFFHLVYHLQRPIATSTRIGSYKTDRGESSPNPDLRFQFFPASVDFSTSLARCRKTYCEPNCMR